MTAQATFRAMMSGIVAPRLRTLGWKGSSQNYELPDPLTWVLLGFQLSRYNTAASSRFTINVSVIGKEAWAAFRDEQPARPQRPKASANYSPSFCCARIGDLMPADEDIWWELSADRRPEDVVRVADHVYSVVAEYAMPEIRRRLQAGQV